MCIKQAGSLPEVFKMHFHIAANRGMLKNSLALFLPSVSLRSHQNFLLKLGGFNKLVEKKEGEKA